ncbi:MAG: branched-chain amino acid aminotransferase [Chitinophagales bacterium]|nr:branched-chain amino acid aminotransferase [Chitinophagales bacterium]
MITITEKEQKQVKDTKSIPFGITPTDHMFISEYSNGGWSNSRIVPFENLSMSPIALCLHYGQTVFEGMKAFKMADGRINIFRADKHYDRFCKSLDRMCMPAVPETLFQEALKQLVQLDAAWIPEDEDGSLYIRPFMIASEERLGVKISDNYIFMIVCTPAYQYYAKPLRVKVEEQYSRAAFGGTGFAKCGGNYGGAYYPARKAQQAGYDQVMWTDSRRHEYIEESGTMNLMFYMDEVLVTPPLGGTILDGVTRDSLLALAEDMGMHVAVRPVTHREIKDALEKGKRVEAFGAGTAAVVAPIEAIGIGDTDYNCYIGDDSIAHKLKDALNAIRNGEAPDKYNWNTVI